MNRVLISLIALFSTALPFLIDSALKGTALIILAAVGVLALRKASAATRHLVWLGAVVALIILPVLSAFLPAWRILPRIYSIAEPRRPVYELNESFPPPTAQPPISVTEPQATSRATMVLPATPTKAIGFRDWLPLVWVVGFALLVVRLLAAQWLLSRLGRRCRVVENGRLLDATLRARKHLDVRQSVQLLLDSRRTIPMVWGVFRPRLLLPAEVVDWDETRLRSVLLHELAHVKRHDAAAQWLMQLACALHWYNPFIWFAAWRLHVESERACDDLVLTNGVRASDYADHLLHVATNLTSAKGVNACGLAMARPSRLEGRLLAVLNERLNRRKVTRTLALSALLLVLCVVIPVAMLRATPANVVDSANTTALKQTEKPAEFSSLPEKPWMAEGRVTDRDGKPLEGVEIWVHAGIGTLRRTGLTKTDREGRYQVSFGRGMWMPVDSPNLQFANVTAHKPGFVEVNLSRHGARAAALREVPAEELKSYSTTAEQMFLPDKPQTIDFVMVSAGRITGRLLGTGSFPSLPPQSYRGKEGEKLVAGYQQLKDSPLARWRVWLVGKELPPASSVLASAETDQNGEFVFEDVPTGLEWQLQADTHRQQKEPKSQPFSLREPLETHIEFVLPEEQNALYIQKKESREAGLPRTRSAPAEDAAKELARAKLNLAETEFKRVMELRQQNLVSETEFRKAETEMEIAKAQLAGRAEVVAQIKVRNAETELKRLVDLQQKNLVSNQQVELAKCNLEMLLAEQKGDAAEVARVRLRAAESNLRRLTELRENNLVAESEVERAKAELVLRKAELKVQEAGRSAAQKPPSDDMSELTKARNEARVKAEAVEQRLRKNGASAGQLGFDEARAARDKELAVARDASERIAAYERYAEEAERLERQIQKDIEVGKRPVGIGDIAHYERLQAEVELARAKVPASAATPDKSVVK